MTDKENHECLYCGKEVYGRADKKFCSDKCRSDFHNKAEYGKRVTRIRTMNILDRNYGILSMLLVSHVRTIDTDAIKKLGFNPESCTGISKNGHLVFRCFDISYRMTENKIWNIRREKSD